MTNKFTQYGLPIIAAVLLVAMACAGAAGAVEITASEWNSMTTSDQINGNASYSFIGDGIIYPKFNGSGNQFVPNRSITFDFEDFTGTFAGDYNLDSGYRGALFGNIKNTSFTGTITIQHLRMSNVTVNSASSGLFNGEYIGSIVGYFEGQDSAVSHLNITDCEIINCAIGNTSSNYDVGGMVGYAGSATVNFEDCKATHCDVVSAAGYVGGLVGQAGSANIVRCMVANSTVASSNSWRAGGLVGGADSANFDSCRVENVSVFSVSTEAGGVIGTVEAAISVPFMKNCTVKNSIIVSCANEAGGLVGAIGSANTKGYEDCHVVSCTIRGGSFVGGMVGDTTYASTYSPSIISTVEDSAVTTINGASMTVRLDCGTGLNVNCMANLHENFIYNATAPYTDTIKIYNVTGGEIVYPSTIKSTYWKTVFNATGQNASSTKFDGKLVQVTCLGPYGVVGGYGVGSAPEYTVTYDGNGNESGSVPTDGNSPYLTGSTVSLLGNTGSLARTCYHFTGWNKDSASGTLMQAGEKFMIAADTVFYANWTPYTYNVTFNRTSGYGLMETQTLTYDVPQTLSLNTFTKSGYHFAGWNRTDATGTAIDFTDGQPVMNLTDIDNGTVTLYAVWEQNPAPEPKKYSDSKDLGSTVILTEPVTPTPTATPTATAVPTIATVNPTSQQTSKSPVPFVGLIAGLGAAAVLLRLRK